MFVFLNDRFVSANSAKVSVFDPGFQHGEGLFETLLIRDGEPQLIREHLRRLTAGAQVLQICLPKLADMKEAVLQLARKNKIQKGLLRISATPENFFITTRPWPQRAGTATACCVPMERCLPHIKSMNYLPTVLAQRAAAARGFDEALLVDRAGYVTEGGRTNFFWIKNGTVFTPDLESALPGITRGKVIIIIQKLGLKFFEKRVKAPELVRADEVFLTNAPMEIWPVTQLETRTLPVGSLTQQIRAAYLQEHA